MARIARTLHIVQALAVMGLLADEELSAPQLAERLRVELRTMQRLLASLEAAGLPVERRRRDGLEGDAREVLWRLRREASHAARRMAGYVRPLEGAR